MGLVTSGIPYDIVAALVEVSGTSVFVETGTFQGSTTRWAADRFETVHTIELSRSLFDEYSDDLAKIPNVTPHFGDSATVLPGIVDKLGSESALFWLDGHWSGGETAGEENECPIIPELECLSARPNDLILIDDARLFLCAPPKPHKPEQWPTMSEIIRVVPEDRFVQVINDVIYIVPNHEPIRACLIGLAQKEAETAIQKAKGPSLKKFARKLLSK